MQCVSLFSGSRGNAVFVRRKSSAVLVDAGVSFRRLCLALEGLGEDVHSLDGVFFTHEHSDHTLSLPMLLKKTALPFYLDGRCAEELYEGLLSKDPSLAAEFVRRVRTVEAGGEYEIGELFLSPFSLPHDSSACLGCVFSDEKGNKLLGIATDLGEMTTEARRALYGCEAVILESNHDLTMLQNGPYPPYLQERIRSEFGHLSNPDCAAFLSILCAGGLKKALLFHLSEENNTPRLALDTAKAALQKIGSDVPVCAAAPSLPCILL